MDEKKTDRATVAALNDILQLDHDAVHAYRAAIAHLDDEGDKEKLRAFLADHERHVSELSELIRGRGGSPMKLPHLPTGFVKLAVQQLGRMGGDRGILRAFVSNELQVRDKYRRHAERATDPEIRKVLQRGAEDEQKHYTWAVAALERHGGGDGDTALDRAHARTADMMEAAGRKVMEQVGRVRS